jgi:RimJ/RimL family protein N-acetyltransferase
MDVSALFGLRLRTPRLELRLPTDEELLVLREVALDGIHPPDFMPFSIAWTDDPELSGFVEFHALRRRDWKPGAWELELGVWRDGELVGSQEIGGQRFAETRTVGTGSWLGSRFQRIGIGTEMRTAVLELAFRGLGAALARSGAIDGNIASLRVSEKLGYRITGHSTCSPRGVEVRHADLELRRERWHPPFPVEIVGLEPCLPLFGV